jgi:hypothetical protein
MTTLGSDLVDVIVETHLGARYVFPDMPRTMLDNVIQLSGWERTGQFVLVNVSSAVLTMPARLVKSVAYDGEVKWTNAPVPELQNPG